MINIPKVSELFLLANVDSFFDQIPNQKPFANDEKYVREVSDVRECVCKMICMNIEKVAKPIAAVSIKSIINKFNDSGLEKEITDYDAQKVARLSTEGRKTSDRSPVKDLIRIFDPEVKPTIGAQQDNYS